MVFIALLHSRTLQALKSAGWTPERHVDPLPYIQYLEQEGFLTKEQDPQIRLVVQRFFAEFGGLQIQFPSAFLLPTDLNFAIIDEHGFDVDNVADDSIKLETDLCPIGEQDRMFDLLAAPDGSIYIRYPDACYYCGSSNHEAIDAIVTNAIKKRIF